jgi:hypothetical protein
VSVLTSPLLESLLWLEHGFGTRAAPLSQDGTASLKQIHSSLSVVPESVANGPLGCIGEGDALLTSMSGVTVSIRTADCFPILLADPVNRAVAAIHAGWRGTAAEIVLETLRRMREEFGTKTADVLAAIGPGIGACCYQVGEDVARQFGKESAGRLDLAEENRGQLMRAGVAHAHVDLIGACTFCDATRFHSFRREGERAGRMISYVGIRKQ